MNYKNNKKRKIIFIVLLAVALTATIGYAVLNTVLKNNIAATISPVSWKVFMENPSIYEDTTEHSATNAVSFPNTADTCIEYDTRNSDICTKSVTLNANINFDTLDEYVIIKFNATNAGDIPAIIDENGVTVEGLGELVTYSLKYSEQDTGEDVKPGDTLAAGTSKSMYLKLKYFISDAAVEVPTEEQLLNITINIKYIKGNTEPGTPENPDTPAGPSIVQNIVSTSTSGSSSEITSYTTAMTASDPSKLYLLESTKDDQYPIYFWRGTRTSTQNNFIFANMCWLGIRTTDTGGIKIMFNGYPEDGQCTATTDRTTVISSGEYDSSNSGAKYKNGDVDSDAKKAVENWYKTHLLIYDSYLEDTVFCNDLGSFYSEARYNGTPSLACSTEDSYTVTNGKLKYKVGLISADEEMFSGMAYLNNPSTEPFLYNSLYYWTMTQGTAANSTFIVARDGRLNSDNVTSSNSYRPVVSLASNIELTGKGTQDDPFVVNATAAAKIGAQGIIDTTLTSTSSEITSYGAPMTDSGPSNLYLLESTKEEQHPVYFWRGTRTSTLNNFIFANMCWLGIRTTDTGGIKIIYNGTPVDGKCTATGNSTVISSGGYDSDPFSIKYKDGTTDSDAKTTVENWYKTNLLTYETYLEDTVYCNDTKSLTDDASGEGIIPSLECSTENSYTVHNGKLKYKVGLISADEAIFSGLVNGMRSASSFLNSEITYWTMTAESDGDNLYNIGSSGVLALGRRIDEDFGFRPVVSLDADVEMFGSGTQNDPFVVTLN